jgi:hypothetical protein
MSTNAGIVSDALKYVYSKDRTDRHLQRQKLDKRIEAMDIQEQEEETTTNGYSKLFLYLDFLSLDCISFNASSFNLVEAASSMQTS